MVGARFWGTPSWAENTQGCRGEEAQLLKPARLCSARLASQKRPPPGPRLHRGALLSNARAPLNRNVAG